MSARTEFHGDPIEENTLYVVLYERKAVGEAYHWALLLAGPGESGQIHQATDRNGQWEYEIKDLPQIQPTASMICLVGIGNIQPDKRAKAEEAMRSVHVPPEGGTLRTGEPFNCRTWLKLAVAALQKAGILNLPLHVESVKTSGNVAFGAFGRDSVQQMLGSPIAVSSFGDEALQQDALGVRELHAAYHA
ncbi:d85bf281-b71e-4c31-bc72-72993c8368d1 [Thermothielavioides terrestris]|uniref:D85bf281-b71e-4c31-bc72-72993c8368d1 n=1 Tax=Thermothielavioides terrestris TaxID=2587410 RepID=A0A3S4D282_9PEZI|nr:d85bf281-b71e-4c31-bc72-72993c8368d1 [Thermothielavioides terrestris]